MFKFGAKTPILMGYMAIVVMALLITVYFSVSVTNQDILNQSQERAILQLISGE